MYDSQMGISSDPMYEVGETIKALQREATSLHDNLANLTDPSTNEQLGTLQGFVNSLQGALARLQSWKDTAFRELTTA